MVKEELKAVKKCRKSLKKMTSADSLKVIQNDDGTFALEWDKEDPNWSWMNDLTEEIQSIVEQAVKDQLNESN